MATALDGLESGSHVLVSDDLYGGTFRLFERVRRRSANLDFTFIDMSDAQGAPAWSWDRCIFNMCKKGGAHVRSGGHGFTKCSFALCGWSYESGSPAAAAYIGCIGGG